MIENNCYKCKYQGDVPGSCHSSCQHPSVEPINELMKFHIGVPNILNVTGISHGIKNGWFMWPMDFDPTWLRSCDGFVAKEKK